MSAKLNETHAGINGELNFEFTPPTIYDLWMHNSVRGVWSLDGRFFDKTHAVSRGEEKLQLHYNSDYAIVKCDCSKWGKYQATGKYGPKIAYQKSNHPPFPGGVIQTNRAEWLWEDVTSSGGICLDYEAFLCEYGEDASDSYYQDEETHLIGFKPCPLDDDDAWYTMEGEYGSFAFKPDYAAEYCAIVDAYTAQVIFSQWVKPSRPCSPCYPYQYDLNSPGGTLCYALPPELFGDNDDDDDKTGILHVTELDDLQ